MMVLSIGTFTAPTASSPPVISTYWQRYTPGVLVGHCANGAKMPVGVASATGEATLRSTDTAVTTVAAITAKRLRPAPLISFMDSLLSLLFVLSSLYSRSLGDTSG